MIGTLIRHAELPAGQRQSTWEQTTIASDSTHRLQKVTYEQSHVCGAQKGAPWGPIGHIYALDKQLPRSGCLFFSPPMGIKSSSDWVMGVGVEVLTGIYLESMMSLLILPQRSLRIESRVEKKRHPS